MNTNTDFRTILEKEGVLLQLPVGKSMYPMLNQRVDTLCIEKITQPLKENDVVLYQRDNGKYVLHRIIKTKKDGYVIRGDNCIYNEYDIKDRHIFGILTSFYRKDKYIDCKKNKVYLFYVHFWRATYYIRASFMYIRMILAKLKHKIFK